MSFTDRASLIESAGRWSQRDNLDPEAFDDFIALTEAHLSGRLRVQQMSVRAVTLTIVGTSGGEGDSGWISQNQYKLPATALGIRNIEIERAGRRYPLEYYTPEALDEYFGSNTQAGVPQAYTLTGVDIEIRPCPNAEYPLRIIYYQQIPPLVDAGESNWLLEQYPMAYLYGVLHFLCEYVRDDEGAALWAKKFEASATGIEDADVKDRWSGSTMSMKSL